MPTAAKVVVEAGKKITPRLLKQLTEKGVKFIKATDEDLVGILSGRGHRQPGNR
jgi:molybdopterin biosynthesis enzyme